MSINDKKENDIFDKDYLQTLSRNELVEIGQRLKIKNYSTSTKNDLIKKIIKHSKDSTSLEDNLNKEVLIERINMENSKPEQNESITISVSEILENYGSLDSLSRKELVEIGQKLKIKKYSVHSKAELIKKITDLLDKEKSTLENQAQILKSDKKVKENPIEEVKPTKSIEKKETEKEVKTEKTTPTESTIEKNTEKIIANQEANIIEIAEEKTSDLEELQMADLVEMAKELKVKNYSRLTKARLIKAILKAKEDDITNEVEVEEAQLSEEKEPTLEKETQLITPIKEKTKETESEIIKEEESIKKPNEEIKSKDLNLSTDLSLELVDNTELKAEKVTEEKTTQITATSEIKAEKDSKIPNKKIEKDPKLELLFKPSKFNFKETHKEFLLEDESNIKLSDLPVEKDKAVILPVDPSRIFIYWDLTSETIRKLKLHRIKELIVKVNDVTGIIYNQTNANKYWINTVPSNDKNLYVDLEYSDVNLCAEIGYIVGTQFIILAVSNTVYVPRSSSSKLILDTFVVVNYPEYETHTDHHETGFASSVYINKKTRVENKDSYYNLNDYKLAENYNLRKMTRKMPIFNLEQEIPNFFANEYQIEGKKENLASSQQLFTLPDKLPSPPAFEVESPNYELKPIFNLKENPKTHKIEEESIVDFVIVPKENFPIKHENYSEDPNQGIDNNNEDLLFTINETSYFPEVSSEQIIKGIYHKLPKSSKPVKIYYEWVENDIPYRKVIYWVSDPTPMIHEKVYKISVGPTWVKEFIGGSERIKYLGSSDIYLGSSDINIGGSEMFIESSYRKMGSSEIFAEEAPDFQGSSELVSIGGASERNKLRIRRFFAGHNFRKDFE